ncbi:MAG: glycosyltransferase family 2 protein [Bacteroidetes bacterium]|nr:glycosyltransferase family 2 protein [Bacteroidota bacterium]
MKNNTENILLSICIPTYNRADFLRDAIKYILLSINNMHGLVELIISDNCSTDGTLRILEELPKHSWIHWSRNSINEGPVRNGLACLKLAKGEYIWFVGDDDVIRPEGLNHLLCVLREHIEIDYFVVNAITSANEQRIQISDMFHNEEILKEQKTKYSDLSDRKVISFNEYLDPYFDPIFLGSIMCNILRRSVWEQGLTGVNVNAPMGTIEGTYLVCCVLARTMVGKPSFYIGFPCSVAFWGHQEWQGYLPIIFAYTFYHLLDNYETHGVESWRINKCRRYLHLKSGMAILKLNIFKDLPGRELFSFKTHLYRYWAHVEFWKGLFLIPIWRFVRETHRKIKKNLRRSI